MRTAPPLVMTVAVLALLVLHALDQRLISRQLHQIDAMSKFMNEAREALQAQGNALDECMKAVDPTWTRPTELGHIGTQITQ